MHRSIIYGLLAAAAPAAAGPCDIYDAAGAPCVAAHSVTRALYDAYAGPLYQVKRASDGGTADVGVRARGGAADAGVQDRFCAGTACVIQRIYDQSPKGNHLDPAPAGGAAPHPDAPVNATRHTTTLAGTKVYGAQFETGMGYRNDATTGVATGDDAETVYMVVNGRVYNGGCCFDYGNAETDNNDDGEGTMEAVYFGSATGWGRGAGDGPWIMADLENGLWAGNETVNPSAPSMDADYVVAMINGRRGGTFGVKGADAQGGSLATFHAGPRPPRYENMAKQGAIILGIGGDNSDRAVGIWYEGVMTAGPTDDAADAAVHEDIVAAGYGK